MAKRAALKRSKRLLAKRTSQENSATGQLPGVVLWTRRAKMQVPWSFASVLIVGDAETFRGSIKSVFSISFKAYIWLAGTTSPL